MPDTYKGFEYEAAVHEVGAAIEEAAEVQIVLEELLEIGRDLLGCRGGHTRAPSRSLGVNCDVAERARAQPLAPEIFGEAASFRVRQ